VRVNLAFLRRVKDHPEECLALVTRQIRSVRGAHHTVAKAVCCALELDGNIRSLRPVESPSTLEDVIDQGLADEERQELMQDQPLVMPRGELAGVVEHHAW
jgi:hypothetical protein